MGTDINFKNHLGRTYGTYIGLPAIDPAASAFIQATGITGELQKAAINNLVLNLKKYNLWSKMKAVYPFVTDNRNLLSYTEDFGNAYWGRSGGGTVLTDTTIAPNGTLTADTFTGSSSASYIYTNTPISSIGNNTFSIYVKAGSLTSFRLDFVTSAFSFGGTSIINLTTGTASAITFYGGASGWTVNVESVGNGWYRCSIGGNISTSQNMFCEIMTGIGNLFIWGAQLDSGSTATTYQPILGSQQAYIASQFKFNLKDPRDLDAAFRLVFNGGWTHSSTGATPNGTNGFADTKLVPSTSLSTSSAHFSKYNRTNDLVNFKLDGCSVTGVSPETFLQHNYTSANSVIGDVTSLVAYIPTDTRGLFNATRTATNTFKVFRNTTNIGSNTNSITVIPNRSVFLGARNDVGGTAFYNTYQVAFASIGDGLTDTEAANLYSRVQNLQTLLNRQV
jgi:hypothetical protein